MPPAKPQYSNTTYSDTDRQTISNGGVPNKSPNKPPPAPPKPSASVLLISPQNHILLLRRVKASSSFPSAHVFPGGNLSPYHEGTLPDISTAAGHEDSEIYRRAALRETFEESGILLARNAGFGRLVEVEDSEREEGRRAVHGDKVGFEAWVKKKGGRLDTEGLVPFTRWVTPPNVPRRFTTQMYLYFLPTASDTPLSSSSSSAGSGAEDGEALEPEVQIPVPTPDGGKEHTTARFLPASAWLRLAQEGRVILFPPQFFLLHQLAQYLDDLPHPTAYDAVSRTPPKREELEARRKALMEAVRKENWGDVCISPTVQPARDGKKRADGRVVLGLERPGMELDKVQSGRVGIRGECVLVDFRKEGPRRLAVVGREEAMGGGSGESGGSKL